MQLIMKCTLLNDQWECDVERTPVCIVSDWKQWHQTNKPNYHFEVWEVFDDNGNLQCIKDYEEAVEQGMVLVWYDYDTPEGEFNIIKKFPNKTRRQMLPKEVEKYRKGAIDIDDSLRNCGYIMYEHKNKFYAYTEYDNICIHCPY